MFSMEQLNKAANAATVNKRYRYPQQPMPNPMIAQPGHYLPSYGNNNANYGMTNPQVLPQQYPQYPSGVNPSFNPGGIPPGNFGIQQPNLPQNYNYNSNQNQYPYSTNVQQPVYNSSNSRPRNASPFISSNNAIGIESQSPQSLSNARPAAPGFVINNTMVNQPVPDFNYPGNGPTNSYSQQY